MELKDTQRINAPRKTVYEAMNDPEILRQCIPGCEALEMTSETDMTATVVLKVGPVKAKFKGVIKLTNLNPPISYTLIGEGKGGSAGSAKGTVNVNLEQDGNATILGYEVDAVVTGKFAQLGGRLIDSTAKKLAGQFFKKFSEIVEDDENPEAEIATTPAASSGMNWKLIAIGAIVIIGIIYAMSS